MFLLTKNAPSLFVTFSITIAHSYPFQCETFVEEHEEDLIQMLRKDEKDLQTKACVDLAGKVLRQLGRDLARTRPTCLLDW